MPTIYTETFETVPAWFAGKGTVQAGHTGNAVNLKGSEGSVTYSIAPGSQYADTTLDFWFNMSVTGTANNRDICRLQSPAGTDAVSVRIVSSLGTLVGYVGSPSGGIQISGGFNGLTANAWHHMVVRIVEGAGSGALIDLTIDGTNFGHSTGANKPGSSSVIEAMVLFGNATTTATTAFDDLTLSASPWTMVQSRRQIGAGGTTLTATFAGTPVTGNKIIAYITSANATPIGITSVKDGAGNSLTAVAGPVAAPQFAESGVYCYDVPVTPSGAITATFPSTSTANMLIQEVSGLAAGTTGALDAAATHNSGAASGSIAGPVYSTAAVEEYLVVFYGDEGGGSTITVPSGYTAEANNLNARTDSNLMVGYKNSAGGSETTGPWGSTVSSNYVDYALAFRLPGGAVTATAALPLGPVTVAAAGSVSSPTVTGSATVALGPLTVAAAGSTVTVSGTVSAPLGPLTLAATSSTVTVTASAALPLGPLTLAAHGGTGVLLPARQATVVVRGRAAVTVRRPQQTVTVRRRDQGAVTVTVPPGARPFR